MPPRYQAKKQWRDGRLTPQGERQNQQSQRELKTEVTRNPQLFAVARNGAIPAPGPTTPTTHVLQADGTWVAQSGGGGGGNSYDKVTDGTTTTSTTGAETLRFQSSDNTISVTVAEGSPDSVTLNADESNMDIATMGGSLTEPQIPSEIARDTEVTTAITNHEGAADPHVTADYQSGAEVSASIAAAAAPIASTFVTFGDETPPLTGSRQLESGTFTSVNLTASEKVSIDIKAEVVTGLELADNSSAVVSGIEPTAEHIGQLWIDTSATVGAIVAPQDFKLEVAKGNISGHAIFEKFGKNPDIDTGSIPEDIWNGGGLYTGQPTGAAETMEIFSSSANDTAAGTGARTVRIFNLLDGTGAAVSDVDVTLNGTTPVSLGAGTYYRGGSRIKVLTTGSGGSNAGTITLRHTTTTSNIFAVMPVGLNQTSIAAYTVPLGKTLYIDRIEFQLGRANGSAGQAEMSFRNRPHGADTGYNSAVAPSITNSSSYRLMDTQLTFPARTDIICRCDDVSDNNSIITAEFSGILVDD